MGNSVIWYLPTGATFLERIDFGSRITARRGPNPVYRVAVNESVSGAQHSVLYYGLSRLSIGHVWTRDVAGTGDALRRKLVTLQAHLAKGGTMIFAEDVDKAFAGFVISLREAGAPQMGVEYDLFDNIASGSPLNCEITVSTDHSSYLYEHLLCDGVSGNLISFSTLLLQDMSFAEWVLLREYGSWPALRVPLEFRGDLDIVPHDHDRIFTLELPLEEDPVAMNALFASGIPIIGTTPGAGLAVDIDIDDVLVGKDDPLSGWR